MKDMKMVDTVTEEDLVLDDNLVPVPGTVVALHNNLIKTLRKEWPAFADWFHIQIDTRGGMVFIRNLMISGEYGLALKIADIDPEMRKVRRLMGEFLERFNVARGRQLSIEQAFADVKRKNAYSLKHED